MGGGRPRAGGAWTAHARSCARTSPAPTAGAERHDAGGLDEASREANSPRVSRRCAAGIRFVRSAKVVRSWAGFDHVNDPGRALALFIPAYLDHYGLAVTTPEDER